MSLACYIQVLASKIYLMSFKTVSITPLHITKELIHIVEKKNKLKERKTTLAIRQQMKKQICPL